jgi:hypothetical protein
MVLALSNAAFFRSPVSGIDGETGKIQTDGPTKIVADGSDGVIPASDNNALFNYVIIKTSEIVLRIQEHFEVKKNLEMEIDFDVLTPSSEVTAAIAYVNFGTMNPATHDGHKQAFLDFYYPFTATYTKIKTAAGSFNDTLNNPNSPASLDNFIDVVDVLLDLLEEANMSPDMIEDAKAGIDDLRFGLNDNLKDQMETLDAELAAAETFKVELDAIGATSNAATAFTPWVP